MKKMIIASLLPGLLLTVAANSNAKAYDLGATISGGYTGTMNGGNDGRGPSGKKKTIDGYNLGAGLVMDTKLDANQLMNYRLGIGYTNSMMMAPGPGNRTIDFFSPHSLHRIMWTNTLGFGIIKKDNFRFWMGPQLALSLDIQKGGNRTPFPGPMPGKGGDGYQKSLYGHLGFAMGIDYTLAKNFSITAELGARGGYGAALGSHSKKMIKIEPFANFGFLYRVGGASPVKAQ